MKVNLEDIVTYKGSTGKVDFVDKDYFNILIKEADHRSFDARVLVFWDEPYYIHNTVTN